MALSPGTRIGPYEVAAQIGAGGMGEVYQATDTNLRRQVALKVLPASVASDAERLARFRREAEVLASLNHPNIAAIHGLEPGDTPALVMELVEGPTLADRLARGAIPVDESIAIAKQIAEALEAAHEQGIVHRDLKPANVKVRPDGRVKVLDFGLAKAMESQATASASMSMSPTITTPAMTQAGMILGTAAYMSPEQAKGRPADRRSDVWAFGCVLYEMLAGKRVFGGEDVSETLADVMRVEPAWEALPAGLSPSLTTFLRRCLQKDPRQRLGDVHDMRLALEGAFETREASAGSPATAPAPLWLRPSLLLPLVAALAFATVLAAWRPWAVSDSPRLVSFAIPTPGGRTSEFALSPDGRHLAYIAEDALWIRSLAEPEPRMVEGTRGAISPFWAPASDFVAFFTRRDIVRVAVDGSRMQAVAPIPPGGFRPSDGAWSSSGLIVFSSAIGLQRVPDSGGTPEPVTTIDIERGELWHYRPQFLPGEDRILFQIDGFSDVSGTYAVELAGATSRQVRPHAAHYAAPGYLLFAQGDAVMAEAFDATTLESTGEPVAIETSGIRALSSSDDGVLAYRSGRAGLELSYELAWLDRQGRHVRTTGEIGEYYMPRLSPDGSMLVVEKHGPQGGGDLYLFRNLDSTGTGERFTFEPARHNSGATWSPDSRTVAFHRTSRAGESPGQQFWTKRVTELGAAERPSDAEFAFPTDWHPDGSLVLYDTIGGQNPIDIWQVSAETGEFEPVLATPASEMQGAFAPPDGRWFAYVSNEDGGPDEVYLAPFPPTGAKYQVSVGGGQSPRWKQDGRELYFMAPDGTLMAVSVDLRGAAPSLGEPMELFKSSILPVNMSGSGETIRLNFTNWDVTADGSMFVGVVPVREIQSTPITVIVNWPSLLAD